MKNRKLRKAPSSSLTAAVASAVILAALQLPLPAYGKKSTEASLSGNEKCPCLGSDYFDNNNKVDDATAPDFESHLASAQLETSLPTANRWNDGPRRLATEIGAPVDPRYGMGCLPHDADTDRCSDVNDCTSIVPLPPGCDKSYCKRSWCFVDPDDCSLLHSHSVHYEDRYYSYATCGELDSFTYTERLRSLRDEVFRVGYASNSGGWKGAYNPAGSFAVNDQWAGPIVDFVREAALMGGFAVNVTRPPDWLRPKSREFFGNGDFDHCVYAVSLGYLDFCVGGFSISERRSSITTMFETTSDPIYLVVQADGGGQTDWESFAAAAVTVFQPFTPQAWIMIFVFCLPILGLLMFFHEYGAPGSAYPREEPVLVQGRGRRSARVVIRPVPKLKHALNSLYMGTLSFFQGSYDQSVVSVGGKINLLAMASFIMLILAVYTANLAAILTQDANKVEVDSIQMAVRQGMNICAERKIANILMETYGVDRDSIVPDPVELGGDGEPGFNCPECNARERIFDSMRRSHSDRSQYCHVAVASQEDLDIMHRFSKHCDKTKVGDSIAYRSIGMPIYDRHSEALSSLFHKAKADGAMTRALAAEAPESQCPETGGEGSALSIQQLTGVWVITFSLALAALLARFVSTPPQCCDTGKETSRKEAVLRRYDQWGNDPPRDVAVDGFRYDSESNELQEISNGVPVKETDSERTPPTPGMDSEEESGSDRSLKTPREKMDRTQAGRSSYVRRGSQTGKMVGVSQRSGAMGSKHPNQISSLSLGSDLIDLEGEVQLLHKTMDVSQEQIAELKRLIIMQHDEAAAGRRNSLTGEDII